MVGLLENNSKENSKRGWYYDWKWMTPLGMFVLPLVFFFVLDGVLGFKIGNEWTVIVGLIWTVAFFWLLCLVVIPILVKIRHYIDKTYFTCKICNEEFYKDYQIAKDICKDCYGIKYKSR